MPFATIADYNAAVPDGGTFDRTKLDELFDAWTYPGKTHWAQRLDVPPYRGCPDAAGHYLHLHGEWPCAPMPASVERMGQVFDNVFAAGEIMSGNILSTGYLAGFGMTIGTVWGRVAGTEAVRHVL